METKDIEIKDIVYREDLYPRFEPDPERIQQYAQDLEMLPPVEINQHNELIDGYHRWTAHRKEKRETIKAIVTNTTSDIHLLKLAIERNSKHGLQLSSAEKKHLVLKMYTGNKDEKEEFSNLLSITKRTVSSWTSRRDKDLKVKRDQDIFDMWLACYTEDEIAEKIGVDPKTVRNTLNGEKSGKKENLQKLLILANHQDPDFTPPIYNIWKLQNKTNKVSHFGNSEASLLDNLLYLYTEPFDIVVDPFAGGGSTIDVCKKRLRRYWVSDRLPIIERLDIRQLDITQGIPQLHKRWGDVKLLYLDPPYWIQAEGKYSQDKTDLANMPFDEFYKTLTGFIFNCSAKMKQGSYIALMIQPTQWKNDDKSVTDHIIDLVSIMSTCKKLSLEIRISCPYESQQANAQQVQWAKDNRKILVLSREIIVWRVIDDTTSRKQLSMP
jgi:transcriptional regulator with XRE-family HTH domain